MPSDANRQEPRQAPSPQSNQPNQRSTQRSARRADDASRRQSANPSSPGAPSSSSSDSADDDALLRALAEEDDSYSPAVLRPPTRPAKPIAPPTTATTAPTTSGGASGGAPNSRVIRREVLPTLERHELVRGPKPGEKYLRKRSSEDDFFRSLAADEMEVKQPAPAPQSGSMRLLRRARFALFGAPLTTTEQAHERLTKVKALAVLSSDAISSVAYATEASLAILITAGLGALRFNVGIALAIALLMIVVGTSYFQTIHAYPQGGGSYIVARDNLGDWPGLVAAAALLIDYVLTVSVSVSAGVDAIVSLNTARLSVIAVPLGVVFILLIMGVNLRGVRESGTIFAAPTYIFIAAFLVMIVTGVIHAALAPGGLFTPIAPHTHPFGPPLGWEPEKLTLLLILTAFASGCSAMTGVEAISNGVPAFHTPESKNAARTLIWMIAVLVTLFAGTTYLAWRFGVEPFNGGEPTVTSQIASMLFGGNPLTSWFYYVIQIATMMILILAANTSYADFPRLASILARDGWLPKGFSFRGNRLAFSVGIVVLTVLATLLMVVFAGNTEALINLYALGVFTAFTLSQSGMVIHWWRLRGVPGSRWRRSMVINGVGACTTGLVALIIMITKFDRGAWIVVILTPLLVLMFRAIAKHYQTVQRQIETLQVTPATALRTEALIPISHMDHVAERTLAYARSLGLAVMVVHVTTELEDDGAFREDFYRWASAEEQMERAQLGGKTLAPAPQLVVIRSPYRALVAPFVEYVRRRRAANPTGLVTVFLPEYVPARFWERLLHNETALRLKLALYSMRGVVVTNVPYHLGRTAAEGEPKREVELQRRHLRRRPVVVADDDFSEPD